MFLFFKWERTRVNVKKESDEMGKTCAVVTKKFSVNKL